jgi:probable HAF family extracellular repeat protein
MKDLGTLGGAYSEGYGINASGQVTGIAITASDEGHAFLSGPDGAGPLKDLGTLSALFSSSFGQAVNDSGQVVGGLGACPRISPAPALELLTPSLIR